MFRPSDDATVFPFLVPSNFFAVVSLRQAAELLSQIHHDQESATQCRALADEVESALREYAVVIHEKFGRILPYEIDGYGNYYCIDDGNVPSLLSLPYLDAVGPGDPLYLNTRQVRPVRQQPLLLHRQSRLGAGRAARGPGHDLAAGPDRAGAHQHGRPGSAPVPPHPAKDPRRHRLHARGV